MKIAAALCVCLAACSASVFAGEGTTPLDAVNVFTGTSNSRWQLFPGATLPFGMVKLGPDNQATVW